MKQLLTITPTGHIETLQRKKGKGLDIAPLVKARAIKRITLIEWDERHQAWFVKFLLGTLAGQAVTHDLVFTLMHSHLAWDNRESQTGDNGLLLWDDYDTAVQAEIELVEAARKAGRGEMVGSAS